MALRFEDIDFGKGLIRVECSYDPRSHGFVEPKSRSGRRTLPLASVLRQYLAQVGLSSRDRTGLIFSEDGEHVLWRYKPTRVGGNASSSRSPCTRLATPSLR
jgi:hypothetical protein